MARLIASVTGTRAEYGIFRGVYAAVRAEPGLALTLLVTAQHLDPLFGETVREIEADQQPIGARIPVHDGDDSRVAMARAVGREVVGIADALARLQPDVLLLLGDRGEMLAGAVAATYARVPVAHLHGGEVSGTADGNVRHAITKLAHLHLAATETSAARIRRMGEPEERVFVTGAPHLDRILAHRPAAREATCARHGLDPAAPFALLLQHPDPYEDLGPRDQLRASLDALDELGLPVLALYPNSDAGGREMIAELEARRGKSLHLLTHAPELEYIDLLAHAALLVGNSSSALLEAPSLGLPAIDIGRRQLGRERGDNVLQAPYEAGAILDAARRALEDDDFRDRVAARRNPYGDGRACPRIVEVLRDQPLGGELFYKELPW